ACHPRSARRCGCRAPSSRKRLLSTRGPKRGPPHDRRHPLRLADVPEGELQSSTPPRSTTAESPTLAAEDVARPPLASCHGVLRLRASRLLRGNSRLPSAGAGVRAAPVLQAVACRAQPWAGAD